MDLCLLIGVDYHPSFQQIAFLDQETGECGERRLNHSDGEAEKFYRDLKQRGVRVRVGMEATGYSRWFERLLAELGIEVWIGDAAKIQTKRVRKQKTDRNDAQLLLQLLLENNFPRVWVPSSENRDLRQLTYRGVSELSVVFRLRSACVTFVDEIRSSSAPRSPRLVRATRSSNGTTTGQSTMQPSKEQ